MQGWLKTTSLMALLGGLGAQAAPINPRLIPASVPDGGAAAPGPYAMQRGGTRDPSQGDPSDLAGLGMEQRRGSDSGLYVLLGGGAEGYARGLAPRLTPGPAGGAAVGFKGSHVGVEVGYSAAATAVKTGAGGYVGAPGTRAGMGPDLVRNSGQGAVTVGLTNTPFQPYVVGGAGVDQYRVVDRTQPGIQNDVSYFAPVGGGARWNVGNFFTLDARGTYSFLFGEDFVPGVANGDRLGGQVSLGGTF